MIAVVSISSFLVILSFVAYRCKVDHDSSDSSSGGNAAAASGRGGSDAAEARTNPEAAREGARKERMVGKILASIEMDGVRKATLLEHLVYDALWSHHRTTGTSLFSTSCLTRAARPCT